MVPQTQRPRRGFTLFEMLVVLALLVVLLGLLLPFVQKLRESAGRIKCSNNLKQLVLACHNANDTYGKLPPCVGSFPNASSNGTLQFYLLPFVEQDALYTNAGDGAGNFSVWNKGTYSLVVPLFFCPNDASGGQQHTYDGWLATTSYASNFLAFGLAGTTIPAGFPDGTSNTIMFAERYQICNQTPCAWAYSSENEWAPMFAYSSVAKFQQQPTQAQCNPALAQGLHPGGINAAMADGSVRSVHPTITPQTWYYACCPNDGMPLGEDW